MSVMLSAVLSIHNRRQLFERALHTYLRQTLPPEEWEIVLVDDLSTVDLRPAYEPFLGRINLTHVYLDHTRHFLFRRRNPNWVPGMDKDWFHTPALSINAGASLARGKYLALCHPEVLHGPQNFSRAISILEQTPAYLFGKTFLGDRRVNQFLEINSCWSEMAWDQLIEYFQANMPMRFFGPMELYWYTSFLPKAAVEAVRGVDFKYLNGVAAEDDDFRDRVERAGWKAIYSADLEGLHQDHSDETEAHRDRTTLRWEEGLKRNRLLYYTRRNDNAFPPPAEINRDVDWTASECIAKTVEYRVGSRQGRVS